MSKQKALPQRIQTIVNACRAGEVLCMSVRQSEVGDEKNFWFEPSGRAAPPKSSQKAIDLGLLKPRGDSLFPDMRSQTYGAV